MALVPAWIVRVQVPVAARARRRPLAEARAVIAAIHAHPRAGTLGSYTEVEHLSIGVERFRAPRAGMKALVPIVTVTTYLCEATRAEVEELARAIAAVHPWEHPVIQCTGPDGAFLWMPDE